MKMTRPGKDKTAKHIDKKQELTNFDLTIKKYGGSLRKKFLADGYTSVDQYINETRGRNAKGELDVSSPFDSG